MPQKLHVKIDNPCSENWDQMRPEAQGRFCGSCQKTVVDFSQMSDQEVLTWLSRSSGSTCGRFYDDQLNRNLLPPPQRKSKWIVFWQLLLAGLLVSSESSAQSPAARQETIRVNAPDPIGSDTSRMLRGTLGGVVVGKVIEPAYKTFSGSLKDKTTGLPIRYASIQAGQTKNYYTTDKDGRFELPLKVAKKAKTLSFSCIGYAPGTFSVDQYVKEDLPMDIQLAPAADTLPSVTVVGYSVTKGMIITGGLVTITRTDTFLQKIKDTLAVINLAPKALTLYPNPVSKGASITLSIRLENEGVYTAQLYSAAGALIETQQIEAQNPTALMHIPATLAAGIYFVKLSHPLMKKVYTQELSVL